MSKPRGETRGSRKESEATIELDIRIGLILNILSHTHEQ